jgi:uncharacterized protein (DUF433 family)
MGVAAEMRCDPLIGGFYSPVEAARLLRIDSSRRVSRWVAGHSRGDPVILADHEPVDRRISLSFLDMMEVRFLEHFRKQGVPLQTLRRAVVRAREDMRNKHPFALSNVMFLTDRRKVFGHAAEDTGDKNTWDLVTRQYEMYDAIEDVLAKGVAFDPLSGLAESFPPLPEYPSVIVNPRFAYGKPVVGEKGVPTSALFRLWRAEGGNKARVARAYEIDERDVTDAVNFEITLAAA